MRGIERVPEDERSNKHTINIMILWFSVNTVLTTVPIGESNSGRLMHAEDPKGCWHKRISDYSSSTLLRPS